MQHPLIQLTAILVLGIGAQWLSWRLRLPSILLLLIAGFVAGPATGFLKPDLLLGDLLFPIVSLSVAIILFEGGLSLDIAELREIGRVLGRLTTIGVGVTWLGVALLAHFLLGFDTGLAILFGAIMVVTGPTVIGPLLRHIRPSERVGSAIRWEGIVNDPIGAILAVLVFEAISAGGSEIAGPIVGIMKAVGAGGLLGLLGAGLLVLPLWRFWIPDFLQNPAALAVALATFALSDYVQPESGLLAVTVMGSAVASQKLVAVQHIVEFKENLRVLLISGLFIVLAARVPREMLGSVRVPEMLFLAGLILLVRPAAVALGTWGTKLTWRERFLLGVMAPRGIVAAAVASVFALELARRGYPGADRLVSITFLVIVGTVVVYGLSAAPVARWLGVASPNPQGVLLVGADPWIRSIAQCLSEQRVKVLLVDSNWSHVAAARSAGLVAHYGNILDEAMMDTLELEGIGRMMALTSNDEVNALAALHFGEVFGRDKVYQLSPEGAESGSRRQAIPKHLRGRFLFAPNATSAQLVNRFAVGQTVKATPLTEEFGYENFRAHYGDDALPLFAVKDPGQLVIYAAVDTPNPKAGQTLISLVAAHTTPMATE